MPSSSQRGRPFPARAVQNGDRVAGLRVQHDPQMVRVVGIQRDEAVCNLIGPDEEAGHGYPHARPEDERDPSPLSARFSMGQPTASKACRTSASRVSMMPEAMSMPPGSSEASEFCRHADDHVGQDIGDHDI